jgi:hypothetical protein
LAIGRWEPFTFSQPPSGQICQTIGDHEGDEPVILNTFIYGGRELDVWEPRDFDELDGIHLSKVIWNELKVMEDWLFCFENGEPIPSQYVSEHRERFLIRHRSKIGAVTSTQHFTSLWDEFGEE